MTNMVTGLTYAAMQRLCGTRVAGAVYGTSKVTNGIVSYYKIGDDGKKYAQFSPLTEFLHCPPIPVNLEEMRIADQGVTILPRVLGDGSIQVDAIGNAIYDAWITVGMTNYTVPDWLHEAEGLGVSYLFPRTTQFGLLGYDSRMHFISRIAIIQNVEAIAKNYLKIKECPCKNPEHDPKLAPSGMEEFIPSCLGFLWETLPARADDLSTGDRIYTRTHPSLESYQAANPPVAIIPDTGCFISIPFTGFEIPLDEVNASHVDTVQMLKELEARLPYRVVRS